MLKPVVLKSMKPAKIPGFKAAPGRPAKNVGEYLIKPVAGEKTGFEVLNAEPNILERTKEHLAKFELPPALQPKYLRKPEVLDKQRGLNISKGWRKPRSQQG